VGYQQIKGYKCVHRPEIGEGMENMTLLLFTAKLSEDKSGNYWTILNSVCWMRKKKKKNACCLQVRSVM